MAAKTYLFQPDKKMLKQGFSLTDENGNTVYEAKMLKNALFGGMQFEFVNHLTNQTVEHKVGHTLTTESESNGVTDVLSRKRKCSFHFSFSRLWVHLFSLCQIRLFSR